MSKIGTVTKINGKALYTPKGAAREYGRVGCNFYTGCPHECQYCYLKRGAPSKQLGGNVVQLKKCFKDEADAIAKFKQDIERYKDVLRHTGVFFSFTTDPLIPETRKLTLMAMLEANKNSIPVYILTKDASFIHDAKFMERVVEDLDGTFLDGVHWGFTLTGRDDMEPNASSNFDRIKAMQCMSSMGFKTWASIEPVIDWQHAYMVVKMTLDCCDHYKIGLRSGVKKDYYDLLQSGYAIEKLVNEIVIAGRTVYLKESARKMLRRCFKEDYCNRILSYTVDMDGNKYKATNKISQTLRQKETCQAPPAEAGTPQE